MPPNPRYSWVLSEQCYWAAGVGGVSSSVWRPSLSGFIPPSVIANGASSLPVSSMPLPGRWVSTETSEVGSFDGIRAPPLAKPQAFLAHQRDQRTCSRITSIWCSRGDFIECNSAGMVAAMSSRRDRAFCRTKSSACLSASTAPASPPLLIRARQRRCPGRHLYPASRDVALRRGRCLPRRSVLPRQIWPRSPSAWTAARRRGQVEVGVAFGEHQRREARRMVTRSRRRGDRPRHAVTVEEPGTEAYLRAEPMVRGGSRGRAKARYQLG